MNNMGIGELVNGQLVTCTNTVVGYMSSSKVRISARFSVWGSRSSRTSGQVVLGQVVLELSHTSGELVPEATRTGLSRTFVIVSRCYTFIVE